MTSIAKLLVCRGPFKERWAAFAIELKYAS
jgi:hypothetical protein